MLLADPEAFGEQFHDYVLAFRLYEATPYLLRRACRGGWQTDWKAADTLVRLHGTPIKEIKSRYGAP
jgi:hypothetical protein